MTRTLDMGQAWNGAMALLASHRDLVLAVAGVFFFLPAAGMVVFGPNPETMMASVEGSADALSSVMNFYGEILPYALVSMVLTSIGSVAIARLYLGSTGQTVSSALAFAATAVLTVIVANVISGLAIGVGFLLLIVPGLYLIGRLLLVVPHIADTGNRNPIDALSGSWEATKDNGWRVAVFFVLVALVFFVLYLVVSGVVGLVFSAFTTGDMAYILTGLIDSVLQTLWSILSVALICAVYRQLAGPGASDLAEEFE